MALSLFRNDFGRLFEDLESSLSTDVRRGGAPSMALDLAEDDNSYVVRADLPGVAKEDVSIDVKRDNTLVLKAERKSFAEEKDDKTCYHRVERSYGAVQRSIRMPDTADLGNCSAKLENGVLELTIAKQDKVDTTKKITIQ